MGKRDGYGDCATAGRGTRPFARLFTRVHVLTLVPAPGGDALHFGPYAAEGFTQSLIMPREKLVLMVRDVLQVDNTPNDCMSLSFSRSRIYMNIHYTRNGSY